MPSALRRILCKVNSYYNFQGKERVMPRVIHGKTVYNGEYLITHRLGLDILELWRIEHSGRIHICSVGLPLPHILNRINSAKCLNSYKG